MRNSIPSRELEELGEGLVMTYLKRSGIATLPKCVDIEGIANYLGLTIVYETFAEDDFDKIGFLADGFTNLKVRRSGKTVPVCFPYRTIVLDTSLRRPEESGRRRFTISHETSHYIINRHLPRPAAEYQRSFDKERAYTMDEFRNHFSFNETQADRLGAAMLMPYFIVESALKEFNNGNKIRAYGDNVFPYEERIKIYKMAAQIGVSYTALIIRLKQFNMLEYHTVDEYIEDKILPEAGA